MNSMKIPGQQTLDFKRSASITLDSHRKQTLEFQEDPYDIRRMHSKTCPAIICLCIHVHIVTSH